MTLGLLGPFLSAVLIHPIAASDFSKPVGLLKGPQCDGTPLIDGGLAALKPASTAVIEALTTHALVSGSMER